MIFHMFVGFLDRSQIKRNDQHLNYIIFNQLIQTHLKKMFNSLNFFPYNQYTATFQQFDFFREFTPFIFSPLSFNYYSPSIQVIQAQKIQITERTSKNSKNQVKMEQKEENSARTDSKEIAKKKSTNGDFIIRVQNRNILPNTINSILSYIRRINKSGKIVKNIISKFTKQKNQQKTKRFFAYQIYIKENLNDFTIRDSISVIINHCDPDCSLFTLKQQCFYNKVGRILISHFLKENYFLQVLGKFKNKRTRRNDHLKVHRYLQEVLKGEKGLENLQGYHL